MFAFYVEELVYKLFLAVEGLYKLHFNSYHATDFAMLVHINNIFTNVPAEVGNRKGVRIDRFMYTIG